MRPKTLINPNRIILYEIIAFISIIVTIWIGSLIPLMQGRRIVMEWEDPILETTTIVLVALPTLAYSRRLLGHLHYLEGFLRVCAWCHKVKVGEDWIPFEEFLKRRLSTHTSHGICESCNQTFKDEIRERRKD